MKYLNLCKASQVKNNKNNDLRAAISLRHVLATGLLGMKRPRNHERTLENSKPYCPCEL